MRGVALALGALLIALLCVSERAQAQSSVTIVFTGDLMLGRSLEEAARARNDPFFAFRHVAELLQSADLTVGNLECVLSDLGAPAHKRYPLRCAQALEALRWAGFDVLSLANNHAMDFGSEALLDTIKRLRSVGIATVGAGVNIQAARAPAVLLSNGVRVAFLGYVNVPQDGPPFFFRNDLTAATATSAGVAWASADSDGMAMIQADVRAARALADVVIVLLHAGYEYARVPNEIQRTLAYAAMDAGATAVIGAHPHVLQGVQRYRDGIIAYSLGNFAFDMTVDTSAALRIVITAQGMQRYEWLPIVIGSYGQPRMATPEQAARILKALERLSAQLN
ncbi:MAG: CapA family protein [Anaerolineae bacterium]|nr:CapA family protein [Anaerolineae bacterium]